jgi:hypothetical protein
MPLLWRLPSSRAVTFTFALIAPAALALCALPVACGGKPPAAGGEVKAAPAVDADPYALLPPGAVVVARVDARAVFTNATIGHEVSELADSFVPLGDDAGFKATRDVDGVLAATYATSEGDAASILSGRFDPDKMAHATKTKTGAAIVAEPYAGATAYHAGRKAWAPLTARTLIAGSPGGVKDVLDRIQKGKLDRWEPAWMMATLESRETPATTFAVAGDFASRPLAAAAVGAVSLPWVNGIQQVRATGVLKADRLDVDLTLGYGNAAQAQEAEGGVQKSVRMLDVLGIVLGGVRLQGFQTKLDAADLRCTFGLESQTLHALTDLAPRLLPSI